MGSYNMWFFVIFFFFSVIWRPVLQVPPRPGRYQHAVPLWLNNIPMCGYAVSYFLVHQLMDIGRFHILPIVRGTVMNIHAGFGVDACSQFSWAYTREWNYGIIGQRYVLSF